MAAIFSRRPPNWRDENSFRSRYACIRFIRMISAIPPRNSKTFDEYAREDILPKVNYYGGEWPGCQWTVFDAYKKASLKSETMVKRGQGMRRRVTKQDPNETGEAFCRTTATRSNCFIVSQRNCVKLRQARSCCDNGRRCRQQQEDAIGWRNPCCHDDDDDKVLGDPAFIRSFTVINLSGMCEKEQLEDKWCSIKWRFTWRCCSPPFVILYSCVVKLLSSYSYSYNLQQ